MYKLFSFILIFSILVVSCNNSDKIRKRDILSDDDFFEILKDIHKAEGIISTSEITPQSYKRDSLSLYNYVLKKHNVSRIKFSKTVQYYSLRREEYIIFYDSLDSYFKRLKDEIKVELLKLKEKQKEKLKETEEKDSSNLWNLKDEWILPDDGKKNPIAFKIYTNIQGTYNLKATVKIYNDDRSVNQRMTIIANYEDGSKDINSIGIMLKDGKFDDYDVSISTDRKKKLRTISGWVLDHSSETGEKHAHVKNIELVIMNDDDKKPNFRLNRKLN